MQQVVSVTVEVQRPAPVTGSPGTLLSQEPLETSIQWCAGLADPLVERAALIGPG